MAASLTPWWSKDTVAVVTGANKGVGYGIVHRLAEEGVTVVLTARDSTRGQATTDALRASGLQSVFFHPLDVWSSESAHTLAMWVKEKFGGIDILVNNAGISNNTTTYQDAKDVLNTNYYGVKTVTEALLPLLRASPAGARIINVSSRAGLYERFNSGPLKQQFRDVDSYTMEFSDGLASKFLEDYKAGRVEEGGWIVGTKTREPIYSESKMFLNVYSAVLAKSLAESQPKDHQIFVVGFCPGLTDTDMLTKSKQAGFVPPPFPEQTPIEGADTGVWLALLPKEDIAPKIGKLFGAREEYPFGWVVNF